ncbi:Protein of unknown function [Cotesia congregata]|uniref:Uncharacterized protein n=1 Tax=Cotesia congregata TaxID=51543 RepID=A0A8J2MIU3_COTCN|nr:Protein of unknown function [Cotesia congregata]
MFIVIAPPRLLFLLLFFFFDNENLIANGGVIRFLMRLFSLKIYDEILGKIWLESKLPIWLDLYHAFFPKKASIKINGRDFLNHEEINAKKFKHLYNYCKLIIVEHMIRIMYMYTYDHKK